MNCSKQIVHPILKPLNSVIMGDMAEDILNGDVDQYTGEWIGGGMGYPRGYNHKSRKFNPFKTGGKHLIGKHCWTMHENVKQLKCLIIDASKRGKKNAYIYSLKLSDERIIKKTFKELKNIY